MDPPPLSTAPPVSTTITAAPAPTPTTQPNSATSTPRSRTTDSWDEPAPTTTTKLRLMCSYGGHIIPRPNDKSLCYIGGDTRIIVVDRHTTLSDLQHRLSNTIFNGEPFTLKYQLPNEDLDSLISVSTDEDLENMVEEYDRLASTANSGSTRGKSNVSRASRLRLFLFPVKSESSASSIETLLESSSKSEDWFFDALNGNLRHSSSVMYSDSNSSVNCLLGLDDVVEKHEKELSHGSLALKDEKDQRNCDNNNVNDVGNNSNVQDVQSVPDSPMLDTTSSFGSTSSLPSLANLPRIRVHVQESGQGQKVSGSGIEEQFQQMTFGVGASPPAPVVGAVVSGVPAMVGGGGGGGEYVNRVFSDDERSEQGIPVGYRKVPQVQPLVQFHQQPAQLQQKPAGFVDFPSPDSVSSEGSITNHLSRQRQMAYQEQIMQMQSGSDRASPNLVDPIINDPNNRVQIQQQVQKSEYGMPRQYDEHPQSRQPQQFVHAGVQYVHSQGAGPVPIASYYPMYAPQPQHHPHHPALEQQYVYYVPSRPAQAYNMPAQQQSYSESPTAAQSSRLQTAAPATLVNPAAAYNPAMNVHFSKPEMAGGVYRTSGSGAPHLVQVHSNQHQQQYVGYPQMHHQTQSVAAASGATANYAYEYADPMHAQIYYSPQLAAQYQTRTSGPAMVLPGASSHVPTENMNQQNGNSQP